MENGDKLGSRKLSPKLELATFLGMDVKDLLPRVGTRTPLKEENIFVWENSTTGVEVCKPVGMWVGRHQDHKRRVIKFSPGGKKMLAWPTEMQEDAEKPSANATWMMVVVKKIM